MTINFQLHVPVCDVLTIVELKPLSQDSIVVGEPVPCRLRCRQVAFGDQHLSTPSRLIIDLDLNHDHWLCAGRKRRTVDLKPGGDGATFDDVHLLPKKTGLLLLPEVHVRRIPATVLEDTRATIAEVQRLPSVRHQYFYRNGGEQVMVHPQQQSNFFWLPAHETEGATATSGPSIVAGAGKSHAPFLSPDTGRSTTQWSLDLTSPPTTAPIASGYLRTNLPSNLAFLINNPTCGTPITRATSFTATSTSGTASPGKESKFGGLLSRVAKRVGATSSGARATYSPMSEMSLDERL